MNCFTLVVVFPLETGHTCLIVMKQWNEKEHQVFPSVLGLKVCLGFPYLWKLLMLKGTPPFSVLENPARAQRGAALYFRIPATTLNSCLT